MNTIAVMLLQDIENDLLDISSTQTSFADESDLLPIVSHLSQKYYGCKLILKINDEKCKIAVHESSMQIISSKH